VVFYRGGMARTRTTRWAVTRLAAAAIVAATAAACTDDDSGAAPVTPSTTTTTVPSRVDDGVLTLGAYLPRTGPGAVLGEPMIDAIAQAVRDINTVGDGVLGNQVDLLLFDENSGASMGELALEFDLDAIIGPASSNVALSQLDEVVQPGTGVVTCSPTATALALDDFPDNGYFFRTIASDSLLMRAIARRVANTGVETVVVAYLDDPYGRPLRDAFVAEAAARGISLTDPVGFSPDDEDLRPVVTRLLEPAPGVVVVLGDADDGTRLLAELDTLTTFTARPLVMTNEALRGGRQTIQTLSESFRAGLTLIAPRADAVLTDFEGSFTGNAVDCVNLIALSAVQAGSDAPRQIQSQMASVSAGGAACDSFVDCTRQLDKGLQINYNGLSGSVDLSSTTGDLEESWFEVFSFNAEGADVSEGPFQSD
jgi:branched-chain amino acid transport system substrate-binding protein